MFLLYNMERYTPMTHVLKTEETEMKSIIYRKKTQISLKFRSISSMHWYKPSVMHTYSSHDAKENSKCKTWNTQWNEKWKFKKFMNIECTTKKQFYWIYYRAFFRFCLFSKSTKSRFDRFEFRNLCKRKS